MLYLKFIAQVLATAGVAITAALAGDELISDVEWINVFIAGLGAIAVLGAGNLPAGVWSWMKTYVAAATAGAIFLSSAITEGMTNAEWIQLGLAVLGAIGVGAVPGPTVSPNPGTTANRHVR